jgi:hypothetical protein
MCHSSLFCYIIWFAAVSKLAAEIETILQLGSTCTYLFTISLLCMISVYIHCFRGTVKFFKHKPEVSPITKFSDLETALMTGNEVRYIVNASECGGGEKDVMWIYGGDMRGMTCSHFKFLTK